MSTGKEAEWIIHTSHRSRRSGTATVTPQACKQPETSQSKLTSKPAPKPEPKTTPREQEPPTGVKPTKSERTSKPTRKPEPKTTSREQDPPTGASDDNTESIASAESSMTDDDQHTKTVKDFVPVGKLVPITNQVTNNDVITFQQVISDSLARMSSRYTNDVALKGGYAFLVE